jgi:N-dimethylarginine dimethylaminohydrolase
MNRTLLVSSAEYFALDQHINPYYDGVSVNRAQAVADHYQIVKAFLETGIKVTKVPAPENCQDGVYTANWGLVRNGHVVLSRLPDARKAEEAYAEKIFKKLGLVTHRVPENWLFSGQGDSLICGDFLFAGSGYRSDEKAQQFAAETLGLKLIQLHAVPKVKDNRAVINADSGLPDSYFYDLDLALAVIDETTIAYCPAAFDEKSVEKIENASFAKIKVSLKEARDGFGLNLVSTGQTVIMSDNAPIFTKELEKRNLIVRRLNLSELKKGGGFIRCVSLTLG